MTLSQRVAAIVMSFLPPPPSSDSGAFTLNSFYKDKAHQSLNALSLFGWHITLYRGGWSNWSFYEVYRWVQSMVHSRHAVQKFALVTMRVKKEESTPLILRRK